MALRRAAALLARLPSTSMQPQLAPAVFTRGMSGGLERFKEGQPVQTKRPAYDERDTPHTDKWLEVRPHTDPPHSCAPHSATYRHQRRGHRGVDIVPEPDRARRRRRTRVPRQTLTRMIDHPRLDLTSHRPHHPPSFPNRLRCRRRWR